MTETRAPDPRLDEAHRAATNGEFATAEQSLHAVLADDARCVLALDLLGFVQFFLGRPADAELACRRALAIKPERAYSNKGLGLCLAKQGKLDEGLPYLRKAIALAPDWFDPRWDMAIVLSEAGRHGEALDVLTEAAAALPEHRSRFDQLHQEIQRRQREARDGELVSS